MVVKDLNKNVRSSTSWHEAEVISYSNDEIINIQEHAFDAQFNQVTFFQLSIYSFFRDTRSCSAINGTISQIVSSEVCSNWLLNLLKIMSVVES